MGWYNVHCIHVPLGGSLGLKLFIEDIPDELYVYC